MIMMIMKILLVILLQCCCIFCYIDIYKVSNVRSLYTVLYAKAFGSKAGSQIFYCDSCGKEHVNWVGQCTSCKEWNTVKQFKAAKLTSSSSSTTSVASKVKALKPINKGMPSPSTSWLGNGGSNSSLVPMASIDIFKATSRIKLFSSEFNRVLGEGIVQGSVILLAGEPGIGKSTLLLQLASTLANEQQIYGPVVYLSGEENIEQIASRANRLQLNANNIFLMSDSDVENVVDNILSMSSPPSLLIVDSIQTMRTETCASGVGSVTQIRECTVQFVQLAKTFGCAVLLVGHVTKSGEVAGPRVLEHMVDTVLYMEGSDSVDYRLLRSIKNRYGSTAEVGVFTMTEKGLIDVTNPSELFMSRTVLLEGEEGSAVSVILEGVRPIMAEVQCLVTSTPSSGTGKVNPRRASGGFPIQRLLLICAIIEKRLKMNLWYRDIYLNIVGGLNIKEPAADLAVAVTIISSLADLKVKPGTALIGELGLSSEIRGGKGLDMRISEAIKMGFTRIIIPSTGNKDIENKYKGKLFPCKTLKDAVHIALDIKNIDDVLQKKKKKTNARTWSNKNDNDNNDNMNDDNDNDYMIDSINDIDDNE